jgi:hypothetical protein
MAHLMLGRAILNPLFAGITLHVVVAIVPSGACALLVDAVLSIVRISRLLVCAAATIATKFHLTFANHRLSIVMSISPMIGLAMARAGEAIMVLSRVSVLYRIVRAFVLVVQVPSGKC